jgi:hypothetical protein
MLQCYVIMCARSVTAFLVPPRSWCPGQGPRSPHPKADPGLRQHGLQCDVNIWRFWSQCIVNEAFRCAFFLCEVTVYEVLNVFAQLGRIFTSSCVSAEAFKQYVSKLSIHFAEHFHCPSLQTVKDQRRVNYVTEHNYDIKFYGFMIYLFQEFVILWHHKNCISGSEWFV